MAKMSVKIDELLESKMAVLMQESNKKYEMLEERVRVLEKQCEDMSKDGGPIRIDENAIINRVERSKNLMIYGIPKDCPEPINEIVQKICHIYDDSFDVNKADVFRLSKSKSDSPPVLVKFATQRNRDAVFFGYLKKPKLNLKDVVEIQAETRVYR